MSAEGLDTYEMLSILQRVLLPDAAKTRVRAMVRDYATPGVGVDANGEQYLRKLFRTHKTRIQATLEAERVGRLAVNLEAQGTNLDAFQAKVKAEREAAARKQLREARTKGAFGF